MQLLETERAQTGFEFVRQIDFREVNRPGRPGLRGVRGGKLTRDTDLPGLRENACGEREVAVFHALKPKRSQPERLERAFQIKEIKRPGAAAAT